MQRSMRTRVALTAGAVGALALLGGPAVSLGLDAGTSVTSLTTHSTQQTSTQRSSTQQSTTQHRTAVRHPALARPTATHRAASAPVSATVQGPNPHGQGTALAISLGGKEAVVVARSRGEQRPDGTYHGHTTTLGLFGNDVIGNDTGPGQTAKGPIAPIQEGVLDAICKGSSGNVCIDLLRADSATTTTGSNNHTRIAGLMLGGPNGIAAEAADSNGNINSNGSCQTAHGDVTLLKLVLGGKPLVDLGESASDSNSCPNGTTVHNSSNPLLAIGGNAIPLPGCGANSPGNLIDLSPLLLIACNAGAATGAGGIVNDALAGTLLPGASGPAGTLSGAGTGASAQAPNQAVLGVRQHSPNKAGGSSTKANGGKKNNHKSGPAGNGHNAVPNSAAKQRPISASAARKLPYTGTSVVLAMFVASLLLASGLGLRRLTTRRSPV